MELLNMNTAPHGQMGDMTNTHPSTRSEPGADAPVSKAFLDVFQEGEDPTETGESPDLNTGSEGEEDQLPVVEEHADSRSSLGHSDETGPDDRAHHRTGPSQQPLDDADRQSLVQGPLARQSEGATTALPPAGSHLFVSQQEAGLGSMPTIGESVPLGAAALVSAHRNFEGKAPFERRSGQDGPAARSQVAQPLHATEQPQLARTAQGDFTGLASRSDPLDTRFVRDVPAANLGRPAPTDGGGAAALQGVPLAGLPQVSAPLTGDAAGAGHQDGVLQSDHSVGIRSARPLPGAVLALHGSSLVQVPPQHGSRDDTQPVLPRDGAAPASQMRGAGLRDPGRAGLAEPSVSDRSHVATRAKAAHIIPGTAPARAEQPFGVTPLPAQGRPLLHMPIAATVPQFVHQPSQDVAITVPARGAAGQGAVYGIEGRQPRDGSSVHATPEAGSSVVARLRGSPDAPLGATGTTHAPGPGVAIGTTPPDMAMKDAPPPRLPVGAPTWDGAATDLRLTNQSADVARPQAAAADGGMGMSEPVNAAARPNPVRHLGHVASPAQIAGNPVATVFGPDESAPQIAPQPFAPSPQARGTGAVQQSTPPQLSRDGIQMTQLLQPRAERFSDVPGSRPPPAAPDMAPPSRPSSILMASGAVAPAQSILQPAGQDSGRRAEQPATTLDVRSVPPQLPKQESPVGIVIQPPATPHLEARVARRAVWPNGMKVEVQTPTDAATRSGSAAEVGQGQRQDSPPSQSAQPSGGAQTIVSGIGPASATDRPAPVRQPAHSDYGALDRTAHPGAFGTGDRPAPFVDRHPNPTAGATIGQIGGAAPFLAEVGGGPAPELGPMPMAPQSETAAQARAAPGIAPVGADARAVSAQIVEALPNKPGQTVDIVLKPEELGQVRLSLTPSEAGVTLAVSAERADTLELIRRHIAELSAELRQLGYDAVDVTFAGSDDQDGQKQAEGQQARYAATDTDLLETAEPAAPQGLQTGVDIRV